MSRKDNSKIRGIAGPRNLAFLAEVRLLAMFAAYELAYGYLDAPSEETSIEEQTCRDLVPALRTLLGTQLSSDRRDVERSSGFDGACFEELQLACMYVSIPCFSTLCDLLRLLLSMGTTVS